jgi:hypothetical protein
MGENAPNQRVKKHLIFGYFGPISAASGRAQSARRRHSTGAELQSAVASVNWLYPPGKLLLSLGFFPAFRITFVHRQAELTRQVRFVV